MGLFGNAGGGMKQNNDFLRNQDNDPSGGTSLDYEYKRSKARNRFDIIFCILFVVGVMFYREIAEDNSAHMVIGANAISITAADESKREVAFDEIESVALHDDFSDFDKGELVTGNEARTGISGTFRNEQFGEYGLYVTPKYKNYIVMETQEGVIVFNYESREDTVAVYNLISELMESPQQ